MGLTPQEKEKDAKGEAALETDRGEIKKDQLQLQARATETETITDMIPKRLPLVRSWCRNLWNSNASFLPHHFGLISFNQIHHST